MRQYLTIPIDTDNNISVARCLTPYYGLYVKRYKTPKHTTRYIQIHTQNLYIRYIYYACFAKVEFLKLYNMHVLFIYEMKI